VSVRTPSSLRCSPKCSATFHPLGQHGYPEGVFEAILFLTSKRADWIAGTTLFIDSGVLAWRNAA
jgi:hypothetical protein